MKPRSYARMLLFSAALVMLIVTLARARTPDPRAGAPGPAAPARTAPAGTAEPE